MESFSVSKILERVVTYLKSTELSLASCKWWARTGLAEALQPQTWEAFDT